MYQPKVRDDQVRKLYYLAKSLGEPMTALISSTVSFHFRCAIRKGAKRLCFLQ